MLRINRRKMIGLLLLSVSAIVYVFALGSGQDSIFEYTLLLACLTFALLLNNDFELISPAVLFTAYFLYSIALGPIGLMNMGRFYSYGYTKIILGGLLAFAIGNGICLIAKKRPVHEKEDKPKIRFSFSRIKTLYFLLAVSWSAALYYFIKNRSYLLGDVENGRVAAISGSGALLYTAQVSILLVCMLFDIYIETRKDLRPLISKFTMIFVTVVSSATLIVSGFRAPVGTLFICMIVMYAGKKKMPMGRIVFYGLLCIIGVSVLGAIRTTMSGGVSSTLTSFFTSLYVGNININYMYNTFPGKVDFQYGYTYLINFLMLLPGPDLDFTLWLKEQVGITFSGGGLTPTIIGEFYINFGEAFIFIGFFILGVFSVYLNRYFKRHKESFLAVFYVWQFAHCVSGGIANVSVTVLLYTIVYKCLIMLPYRSTKSFNRRRLADGQY